MKTKIKFVVPVLLSLAALQASAQGGAPGGSAMWFAPPTPVVNDGIPGAGVSWRSAGTIIAHQTRPDGTVTWYFRSDLAAFTVAR